MIRFTDQTICAAKIWPAFPCGISADMSRIWPVFGQVNWVMYNHIKPWISDPCLSWYSEYDQIYWSDHLCSENSLLPHFKLWVSAILTCRQGQHAFRPPWQSDHLTYLTSFCPSQKWSNYQGTTVVAMTFYYCLWKLRPIYQVTKALFPCYMCDTFSLHVTHFLRVLRHVFLQRNFWRKNANTKHYEKRWKFASRSCRACELLPAPYPTSHAPCRHNSHPQVLIYIIIVITSRHQDTYNTQWVAMLNGNHTIRVWISMASLVTLW